MKKLPIGIQTFAKIRTGNYCYADKTPLIAKLVDEGEFYFLSRPRRFGKSLLIDTIAEAFSGHKELFTGLFLENNWDWDQKHPVIHIDFAGGVLKMPEQLTASIMEILHVTAESHGISLNREETHLAFSELIRKIHEKTGQQVVVLVDEYDKPILDNITDEKIAREMRDGLRNFYSVLKAQGAHLRFVMLTGVSKFSKVSLFSGLNNLEDITLGKRYGTLCGYTEQELKTVFAEYLDDIDLDKVRYWYNGYNFLAEPVFNPFDVLLYLRNRQFKPYWFETGTPTFLIDLIVSKSLPASSLANMRISDRFLGSFDVDCIEPQPLLFQTGYLTIKEEQIRAGNIYYTLSFPNYEVRCAFNDALLLKLTGNGNVQDENKLKLLDIFEQNDLDKLKDIFHAFFASIPHDWYRKNAMAGYEGYYCSVVYCYFAALGLEVRTEETTNYGQIDMVVRFNDRVYIIEFKVVELSEPGSALAQIKEKKYYERFAGGNREVYLIGVEFSREDRNITRFEWEKCSRPG